MPDERPCILLIEDDASIGEVLKAAFEIEGFEVFWARDGREGLNLAGRVNPSVVLCDMMMPVLDGFGFLKDYQTWSRHAPVIAMSALANYLPAARASGAVAALRKPLELDELVGLARELVAVKSRPLVSPSEDSGSEELAKRLERQRLERVLNLRLDEPAPEPALRSFVDFVARIFEVPVCLISVITERQQYWTAMCGISGELRQPRGGPRQESFCTHAVAAHAPLIVQDASTNPFFKNNPFVTERGFRFYAGVPLIVRTGEAVGTLCILDYKSRIFGRLDLELLSVLSKRILAELDWREKRAHPEEPDASFSLLSYLDAESGLVGREGFLDVLRVEACRELRRGKSACLAVVGIGASELPRLAEELGSRFRTAWIARLGAERIGLFMAVDDENELSASLEAAVAGRAKMVFMVLDRYCGASEIALGILENEPQLAKSAPAGYGIWRKPA